jgi:hypothetical protein
MMTLDAFLLPPPTLLLQFKLLLLLEPRDTVWLQSGPILQPLSLSNMHQQQQS